MVAGSHSALSTRGVAERLPASMPWAIVFDLHTFGELLDEEDLRNVFFLPPRLALDRYSHVALTPAGRLLAPLSGDELEEAATGLPWTSGEGSLPDRFRARLELVEWEDADCLGLARMDGREGVVLAVDVDPQTGWGHAETIWNDEGADELDALLSAVGVHPLGSELTPAGRLSRIRIHVPTHIQAARLGSFERSDHCTVFFIRQGQLDGRLRHGLERAGADRVRDGCERARAALRRLSLDAVVNGWATRCEPPEPARAYPYGDVAPLGLVLRALRAAGDDDTYASVRAVLESNEREGLWPFGRGGLPTATDSALAALGLGAVDAARTVDAFERFRAGDGGYVPQLWSDSPQPGRMPITDSSRHWCRSDYGTTALLSFVQRAAGTDPPAVDYLAERLDRREGLFFPNPFLGDWLLAGALGPSGSGRRLLGELLAAVNADHTFGRYDVPWSTALGALALAELGYRGRTLRLVQLRLLDFLAADGSMPADSIAFSMSLRLDTDETEPSHLTNLLLREPEGRVVSAAGSWFGLTWFRDTRGLLGTSLAALALGVACEPDDPEPVAVPEALLRYRASSASEYIARFALPPYVD